jgi:hypothetical protein
MVKGSSNCKQERGSIQVNFSERQDQIPLRSSDGAKLRHQEMLQSCALQVTSHKLQVTPNPSVICCSAAYQHLVAAACSIFTQQGEVPDAAPLSALQPHSI